MKYIAIIPALKKNRYSKKGDLHSWGGSNLLEWKISQVKKIKEIKKIYVSTPDKEIITECKKMNINCIFRKHKKNLSNFHYQIAKKFNNENLLFINTTSPFLSSSVIEKAIKKYKSLNKNYDSLCTVNKNKDYFFYKNKSINFDFEKSSVSRLLLKPLVKLTNGLYIINSRICLRKKNIIGDKPFFFELDWMSGLEINSLKDIGIYNLLINYYFEKDKR